MRKKLEGKKEFLSALKKHGRDLNKAFKRASGMAADELLYNIDELVPLDTGALRASGGWFQLQEGGCIVTVIGYGFPVSGFIDEKGREKDPTLYAVVQHEEFYNHDYPEIDHYLEVGLWQEMGNIANIITTELMRL